MEEDLQFFPYPNLTFHQKICRVIHVLLVITIIVFIVRLIQGRR